MTTNSGLNVYDALRDTILIAVHQQNFRNGAFVNLIAKNTPLVSAFDIMITSSHLSSSEKEIVRSCRKEFIAYRNRFPGNQQPTLIHLVGLIGPLEKLTEMFQNDARERGHYVPPDVFQVMNDDGSVDRTITLNDDGTGTTTKGGVPGVPPGAPEGFVNLQMENTKLFKDAAKKSGGSSSAANTENKKSSKKETRADFGKGFSQNLRGAFM